MVFVDRIKSLFLSSNKAGQTSSPSRYQEKPAANTEVPETPSWPIDNQDLYLQLEERYYQYFIGVNSLLDLDLNPFEIKVINVLEQIIREEHSLASDIPRLPEVVPKVLHLLKTDNYKWKDVADLISSDPVVLIEIIKIANSSAYNLQANDKHLETIIAQLGFLEVRMAVTKAALKPIMLFDGGHFLKHSGRKIWEHAVNTAIACRTLAEVFDYDPFDAYLAGILSNLGMVIVVKNMNEIKEFTAAPRSLQFKDKLLKQSKQLTITIADNWDMQPNIMQALTEQLHTDAAKIKTPLGNILQEAAAVSMQYILESERLLTKTDSENNNKTDSSFSKAYKKLDQRKQ